MFIPTIAFMKALVLGPNFVIPPPGPVTVLLDNFVGPNGQGLDGRVPDLGPAWSDPDNVWQIQSNREHANSTGSPEVAYLDSGKSDVTAQVIFNLGLHATGGIVIRLSDTNDFIMGFVQGGDPGLIIYENNGGSINLIAQDGTFTCPLLTDTLVRIIANADSITLVSGSHSVSVSGEFFNLTETNCGIYNDSGPTAVFGNFKVTHP